MNVWLKRILLNNALGLPAYGSNLLFVALLVSEFHFAGLLVLSPVIVGDIFGIVLNAFLSPVNWRFYHRFSLFDEPKAKWFTALDEPAMPWSQP